MEQGCVFIGQSRGENLPAVVYFHGGGWVVGGLDTHDCLCRSLANRSEAVVIAVDYDLSPEHKYPRAVDQCFETVKHIAADASEFGINAKRLAVAGDSAGGNLAAAVALKARDESGPNIQFQLLIYPVVDTDFETESYRKYEQGFGLTRSAMMWFWDNYLQGELAEYSKLLSGIDLAGLPPTYILAAELDVLYSEGMALAERLSESAVPVTYRQHNGVIHGFVHFKGVFDVGEQAVDELCVILKNALA